MYKLTLKSNIDFGKLSSNLNKILDKTVTEVAKDASEVSKMNIDNEVDRNNQPIKPLHRTTIEVRDRGQYFEDTQTVISKFTGFKLHGIPVNPRTGLQNIGGKKPLKYTGSLYDSIKSKKNALEMLGYGLKHDKGYKLSKWGVPSRKFIHKSITPRIFKVFKDLINKGLKIWAMISFLN